MMDLLIAWRNIWRNPRRTAVILAAVIIGVWSMVFLGALMRGVLAGMIENGIRTLTGHIQIHEARYPADPVVEYHIPDPVPIEAALEQVLPAGSRWSARVRVNAVAANARHNRGVTLVGIDPAAEAAVSFIGGAVTSGRYLQPDDSNAVLVGRALAEQFETEPGRKLIVMSQEIGGSIASRAFRIRGIFDAEMEADEKTYLFVPRAAAQQMLKLGGGVSEVAVVLPQTGVAEENARKLRTALGDEKLLIRAWPEVLPLLRTYLDLYDTFILIWFAVVFVAMGFGIVNTTLMAVFERMREFGLLKALGMRPGRIVRGILTEAFFILLIGMAFGTLLGLGCCWALSGHGIDLSALAQGAEYAGMSRVIYPVVQVPDVVRANLVVLGLGLLVCLYPAVKAARFSPVAAMAHE